MVPVNEPGPEGSNQPGSESSNDPFAAQPFLREQLKGPGKAHVSHQVARPELPNLGLARGRRTPPAAPRGNDGHPHPHPHDDARKITVDDLRIARRFSRKQILDALPDVSPPDVLEIDLPVDIRESLKLTRPAVRAVPRRQVLARVLPRARGVLPVRRQVRLPDDAQACGPRASCPLDARPAPCSPSSATSWATAAARPRPTRRRRGLHVRRPVRRPRHHSRRVIGAGRPAPSTRRVINNMRSPSLDLDSVYGKGPALDPFLYDVRPAGRAVIGVPDAARERTLPTGPGGAGGAGGCRRHGRRRPTSTCRAPPAQHGDHRRPAQQREPHRVAVPPRDAALHNAVVDMLVARRLHR